MPPKFKAKKVLKHYRLKVGLQQAHMAEAVSLLTGRPMSLSRYEKIERGVYEVSLNEAIMICKMFPDKQITDIWRVTKDVEKPADVPKNRRVIHTDGENEKKE